MGFNSHKRKIVFLFCDQNPLIKICYKNVYKIFQIEYLKTKVQKCTMIIKGIILNLNWKSYLIIELFAIDNALNLTHLNEID